MNLMNIHVLLLSGMMTASVITYIEQSTISPTHWHDINIKDNQINLISCSIKMTTSVRKLQSLSRVNKPLQHSLIYLSFILLLRSADIEPKPGPRTPKYPCQICSKAVTWKHRGVACDDCCKWYHADCMLMSTPVYEALGNSNISWHCVNCGMPNFSSSLFESFVINSTQNSFHALSSDESISSPGPPVHSSSPLSKPRQNKPTQPLKSVDTRILVVNFQSIKNKKEEVWNMIDTTNTDIILGTETWLRPDILSSEIFPSTYTVYRKDRKDGYGGVLIAVKSNIISEELNITTDAESIYVKLSIAGNKTILLGCLYRPPNSDINYIDNMCTTIENCPENISRQLSG